ncbi:hypothetical protein CRUP_018037 [Coryphaenoides rupestris]|nr:hypothetical protein CRUP_018037 [Coryphaenoides rupestris]
MSRVLIVGAGVTGSLCACLLRREMKNNVQIVVWDKSKGTGGRMSTTRGPDGTTSSADLGAQYVSATQYYARSHRSIYEELLAHRVLEPLEAPVEGLRDAEGTKNYVTPAGMSSIAKHFLKEMGGEREDFDAVVLTMPVPQILQLQGDLSDLLDAEQRQQLEAVRYSSRYALALFYPPATAIPVPWAVRYVPGHPCICYVAVDDRKRGRANQHQVSQVEVLPGQ